MRTAKHVRVTQTFTCRRILNDHGVHAKELVEYQAGWEGLMAGHHLAAGLKRNAVEITETTPATGDVNGTTDNP